MQCEHFEMDPTRQSFQVITPRAWLTGADDSVPLVVWTFAEPVAIIIAASVPVLRIFLYRAHRPGSQQDLLGPARSSWIPPSDSLPSSTRLGRQTHSWSISGARLDTSIPLQPLGTGGKYIMRTDEIRLVTEQNTTDIARHSVQTRPNTPFRVPRRKTL